VSSYNSVHTTEKKYYKQFNEEEITRIKKRIEAFEKAYEEFSKSYGLDDTSIRLDKITLEVAIFDYFADIQRLKDFHKAISRINDDKIFAYECVWFLSRKPIQLVRDDENLVHINEKFVADVIFNHLIGDFPRACEYDELKEFYQALLYHLIYRPLDPRSLELMIVAFKTSRRVFEPRSEESKKE